MLSQIYEVHPLLTSEYSAVNHVDLQI